MDIKMLEHMLYNLNAWRQLGQEWTRSRRFDSFVGMKRPPDFGRC